MARFVFKLEGVLTQRRHVEHQCQRALAEAQLHWTEADSALRALDANVQSVTADVRENRLTGVLDLRFITAHRRYVIGMQRKALELADAIAKATLVVDQARARLAQAAVARKSLEKLRETAFSRWQADESRKETAQLDEAGMQIAFEQITEDQDRTP